MNNECSDEKEKNFINYLQYRDGAEKFSGKKWLVSDILDLHTNVFSLAGMYLVELILFTGEACNSFFNITILPAFMSWDVKSALSALYPLKAIVSDVLKLTIHSEMPNSVALFCYNLFLSYLLLIRYRLSNPMGVYLVKLKVRSRGFQIL